VGGVGSTQLSHPVFFRLGGNWRRFFLDSWGCRLFFLDSWDRQLFFLDSCD